MGTFVSDYYKLECDIRRLKSIISRYLLSSPPDYMSYDVRIEIEKILKDSK